MNEDFKGEKRNSGIFKCFIIFILGVALGAGALFGSYNYFLKDKVTNNCINTSNTNKDANTEKKSDEKNTSSANATYDSIKDENYSYNPEFGNNFIKFTLSGNDTKIVSFSVVTDSFTNGAYNYYGVQINSSQKYLKGTMTFDKPVKSIEFGGAGQAASKDDCFLFLMQDGTVRYLKIVDALTSTVFTTSYSALPQPKSIEGLDNIDVIYSTTVISNNPGETAGHHDTVAIKKDGTMVKILDYVK